MTLPPPEPDVIEAMARALWETGRSVLERWDDSRNDLAKEKTREFARAALAAADEARGMQVGLPLRIGDVLPVLKPYAEQKPCAYRLQSAWRPVEQEKEGR